MLDNDQLAYELHRPKRKRFPTRVVEVKFLHESWQTDLVEMIHLSKWNHGFKYILTVIDTFSKQAFAEPIRSKSGNDVVHAMERVLAKSEYTPRLLQSDKGTEFYNSHFAMLMKKNGIRHYSTFSEHKASIAERFNRTLKESMYRLFTAKNTLNWVDNIDQLIKDYNNKVHRTIGMRPKHVTKKTESLVLRNIRQSQRKRLAGINMKSSRFSVGDIVRISRSKHLFEKSYTINWSEELFKVAVLVTSKPRTYRIVDMLNVPISGTFYTQELQKTKIPAYSRIEKVLARKTLSNNIKMIRVRWKGYDNRFDQWIPLKESTKL